MSVTKHTKKVPPGFDEEARAALRVFDGMARALPPRALGADVRRYEELLIAGRALAYVLRQSLLLLAARAVDE
jgi:hypothetical protein